jgi:TIR domain/Effector-associated domain 1
MSEWSSQDRTRLRRALAELFPDLNSVRLVAHDAGLRLTSIDFSGSAETVWFGVVEEATKQQKIRDLISVAKTMYPHNDALASFATAPVVSSPSATPQTPGRSSDATPEFTPVDDRAFDLFCSYRSTESARVMKVVNALRGRGLTVFVDNEQSVPGDQFIDVLERGIASSRGGLIFLSPQSVASGWVKDEYHYFLGRRSRTGEFRIVPVLLEDCAIPVFLAQTQHLDLRAVSADGPLPASVTAVIERVADAIKRERSVAPSSAPSSGGALLGRFLAAASGATK